MKANQQHFAHLLRDEKLPQGQQQEDADQSQQPDSMNESMAPSLAALQFPSQPIDKRTEKVTKRKQVIQQGTEPGDNTGNLTPKSTLQGQTNSIAEDQASEIGLVIKSEKSVASAQGTIDHDEASLNGFVSHVEQNQNIGYESRLEKNHRKTSSDLAKRRNELMVFQEDSSLGQP